MMDLVSQAMSYASKETIVLLFKALPGEATLDFG
jgi:hypothetical protein